MKKDVRLLTTSCEHLGRALRGVLRNLEPDDRHALLEAAADRVPLWNFARSRAATRTRASGLVTRIVASPAAWAITISWVCRCMVTSGTTARR